MQFTANWWPICVLPLPNSPYTSTSAWVSNPPPSKSSMDCTLDESFCTSRLRSRRASPETNPPMLAIFFAAAIIFAETASPSSASSARSAGDITAKPRSSSKPASRNFSAVAGPTPGRSSMVTLTSSSSVIETSSSSTGASFFSTSILAFFFDFVGILHPFNPHQHASVYEGTKDGSR